MNGRAAVVTIQTKFSSKAPKTLREAADRIAMAIGLSDEKKRDLTSSLKRVSKMLGRELSDLPGEMSKLRPLVNSIHHVQAGITKKRLANVRSNFVAALRLAHGLPVAESSKPPVSPEWAVLFAKIEVKWHRYTLARLARFSTALGYSPNQVNDEILQRLECILQEDFTLKDPAEIRKEIAQTWNCIIERLGLALTRVSVSSSTGYKTLALDQYPQSFQDDVDLWLKRLTEPDLFADDGPTKPLKAISARNVVSFIRQSAMALVHQGIPVNEINSLSVLVSPTNAKAIFLFFIQRNGGHAPTWLGPTIAAQLLSIARYHAKLPADAITELKRMKSKVMPRDVGMTPKNRSRLQQFDDDANVYRLVLLPQVLMDRAAKIAEPSSRTALMVMLAIAVEILLNIPVRVQTLCSINIETDFKWAGHGKGQVLQLYIPPERVKNGEPIEVDFNSQTSAMIKRYISNYRQLLRPDETGPWLFPARGGGHRPADHLGDAIKTLVYRETGLTVNAHLFRALALELQDREMPGQYESARLLLGHKRSKTTLRFYAHRKGKRAAAAYQTNVLAKWKNPK